jgi:hypothetical protein
MAFGAVAVVAFAVLAALNALPAFAGGEPRGVLRYDSVTEAEARLHAVLWQPRSVAEPWHWPPTRIRVAVGGVDWVQYAFGSPAAGGLVACQTLGPSDARAEVPSMLMPVGDLLQDEETTVNGRPAAARRLLLADGTIVHELWWRWNGRTIMLRLRGTIDALRAAAERAVGPPP